MVKTTTKPKKKQREARKRGRGKPTAVKQPQSTTAAKRLERAHRLLDSAPPSTARERATRERTLALLSDLRRGEGSYSHLLRKHGLDTRTAHRHLGRDLIGGTGGEPVRATKADRRLRELMFPMSFGDVPVRTRSSKDATKLSEFFHDRDQLLRGKLPVEQFEGKWRGQRVADRELFADASAILEMANADELKVENLYASTGPSR